MAQRLTRDGADGVFVGGTTGESLSLTIAERKKLLEAWIATGEKLEIYAHVSADTLADSLDLANHARVVGADAIVAMPPSFFKPGTAKRVLEVLKPVAAVASELPFLYYHIPSMTGVNIKVYDLLKTNDETNLIPSLKGFKMTEIDVHDFGLAAHHNNSKYFSYFGKDEGFLQGLVSGGKGVVGSTYNFGIPHYKTVVNQLNKGDLTGAMDTMANIQKMCHIVVHYSPTPSVKHITSFVGPDQGPTRWPLEDMRDEDVKEMKVELAKIGWKF
eukprot:TRINITY_DN8535_c0_g1_i1.p1 TRINITY_DN8535_c0_g1~~TRINITY_DN8535_c0_g1_i1.p1  ORF type:complete len:317 (-),score=85.88 TRINITY_DN8535_c0_g1_i1:152-967(-)